MGATAVSLPGSVTAAAGAASDADVFTDGATGEIPLPGVSGIIATLPDARLITGFQVFNWKKSTQNPNGVGRIQVQYPCKVGDKIIMVETKTAKVAREDLVPAFKALRAARPDLAKQPVQDFPRGRKGPYDITTFGHYDRNVGDGGSDDQPFTD